MKVDTKIFQRFYPEGVLETATAESLSAQAISFFLGRSEVVVSNGPAIKLDKILRVRHKGGITNIARQNKHYRETGMIEEFAYLFEVDSEETYTGHGMLSFNSTSAHPIFKNKPYAGATFTTEDFRRRHLGIRRLRVLNALSQALYGLPLHSDYNLCRTFARGAWRKLVERGEARQFQENKKERYVFIVS